MTTTLDLWWWGSETIIYNYIKFITNLIEFRVVVQNAGEPVSPKAVDNAAGVWFVSSTADLSNI
jgi:hypothetical protein